MNDPNWMARALHDAGARAPDLPPIDVTDRVLRTLATAEPPGAIGAMRSTFITTAICCAIAGAAVAYAAQTWSTAMDPLAAAMSPVRLALTDG